MNRSLEWLLRYARHPVVMLSFTNGATLAVSFALSVIVGWRFGASAAVDTLIVAQALPLVAASIGVATVQYVCLPYVSRIADLHRRSGAIAAIAVVILVGGGFVGACLWLAIPSLGIRVFGLPASREGLLILLAPFLVAMVPLRAIATFGSNLYQLEARYSLPALLALLGSVVSLAIVFRLSEPMGVVAVAMALMAGPAVIACGIGRNLVTAGSITAMSFSKDRTLLGMAALQVAVYAVSQMHVFWDRIIGARLPEGSLSYLFYSERLLSGIGALVGSGLAVYVLPKFSKCLSAGDVAGARRLYMKAIGLLAVAVIPIAAFLALYGELLVGLVYERNNFVRQDTIATSGVLSYYAPSLVFNQLTGISIALLYSAMKQRTVLIVALVGAVIHLTLALVASGYLGVNGLALAHAVTSGINCALLVSASRSLLRTESRAFVVASGRVL